MTPTREPSVTAPNEAEDEQVYFALDEYIEYGAIQYRRGRAQAEYEAAAALRTERLRVVEQLRAPFVEAHRRAKQASDPAAVAVEMMCEQLFARLDAVAGLTGEEPSDE